jgi:thiol-disulfide isomerase/thioredoxin
MKHVFAAVLILVLVVACSPASVTPTAEPTAIADAPLAEQTSDAEQPSLLADVLSAGTDRPAWQTTSLTNAESGATFTLADFAEKTVFVELIATWCTNCRAQQGQVRAAREQLGEDQYVFISLSVEPNDTTEGLAGYRIREDFPWIFAVAPTEMVSALVDQFGRTVTNPPSTPHFVISPGGAISPLMTGMHSTDQLVAELTTAAGA